MSHYLHRPSSTCQPSTPPHTPYEFLTPNQKTSRFRTASPQLTRFGNPSTSLKDAVLYPVVQPLEGSGSQI